MDVDRSVSALIEVFTTLAIFAVGVAILEGILYLVLVRWLKARLALPILLIAPAAVGLLALIAYPLLWELNVSFTNMSLNRLCDPGIPAGLLAECRGEPMFLGLDNYIAVFTRPVLQRPASSRSSGRRSCGRRSTLSSTSGSAWAWRSSSTVICA